MKLNLKISPTKKQADCWRYLLDEKTMFILFGGGAGGGKSWNGCEWLLMNCIKYPLSKWFIGRNELKRLMGSTYITFRKVCKHHEIPDDLWKLNSQYNYIEFWNGSRIDLLDVAYKPSDPLYERFGSTEYTGGWLEEVGEIKSKAFDVLKSRIGRHLNKERKIMPKMFLTCNPKKNWVYTEFYRPWKDGTLDEQRVFVRSLYMDNPYTAEDYGKMLEQIKDPVMKARLMNGEWEYEDDDSAIFDYDKILAIFDKPYAPQLDDDYYLSVDVARFGRDKAVIFLWHGYYVLKVWYYDKSSATFLEEKIRSKCRQYRVPMENVVVDQDGLGGFLIDHLPGVIGFVNGGRPVEEWDDDVYQEGDRFHYKNLRAQCYFRLADLVNEGFIGASESIEPDVKNWLIQELEAIRRKDVEDNEKRLQIVNKEEMKDSLGRSPDFSDAMMQRMFFDLGRPRVTSVEDFQVDIEW